MMSRENRIRVLEIAMCSSIGTSRWREYMPLSKLGLVEIDGQDSTALANMFGASYRTVKATEKGCAFADEIMHDISFWSPQATEHARNPLEYLRKIDGTFKPCICWACMVARRMAPRVWAA